MDVVSPELNSLLPDEIMDTEAIEEVPHSQSDDSAVQSEPTHDTSVPMETDAPMSSEGLSICSNATSVEHIQTVTTSATTDSTLSVIPGSQSSITISTSPTLFTIKPALATSTATTKTTDSVAGTTVSTSGMQKFTTPFAISAANHQIILNKLASSQATEAAKAAGTPPQVIKQEGQKLLVTAIGKTGQPIVLQLPHTGNKAGVSQTSGDTKSPTPQFKVVTIGGRELKPVVGSPGNQMTTLQAQQLKSVQIPKKTPASSAAPIKFIITKTVNSKGLSPQTSVTPVIAGRVVTQTSPALSPKTITLSEPHNTTIQSIPGQKIAISPLKTPSKVTVVSVASPPSNTSQKSVALPVSVALGQQILAVQQSTPASPVKVATSQTTAQNIKPVQSVTVGGVGGSQFKTIIPLATQQNVQQIQVPGSRFHYVRLVTATTASAAGQPSAPNTSSVAAGKPLVVNAGAVRMSVPVIQAQTMKQVAPKPLTSAPQVVTTSQTQQRLIMPATPLPQIQPNFTNLPPGTVLASAPGGSNVGYAVVPAQYVTQLQQSQFVTLASSSNFPASSSIQTQAKLPYNGVSAADTTSRPRKPCNCTKSQCLKLYCDCFANGEFCSNCNCNNCFNNLEHETERLKAIKTCLDRNPEAFKPKIGKGKEGESDRRHSKGCNCKRSGCLKNYCECYEAKIMCSSICKCVGCKNFEESPERKTLMHLADAAEVRVQQQTAAKTKLSSQISDLLMRTTPIISSGGGRMPYTFVTKEVLEATCECLLEQAKRAEQTHQPQEEAERMILEEFGHCLMSIISSAGKAKADCASINC
ncbi:protein lin-54 homolog [Girardinichthys multiradiatus]|uniref:protein lin-54 homolog n=1 Tax=Girardinichthys multiradiatus TaxID=208333 RepID=UPI001FAD11C0|nr:protein lin-54 homolog [Girardinichthys multiradiatus]XP_047228622.1 protein lin-54 homolog [Girardinichthys multiradiatus]XP_047228623.1 protein lin-54 homolog [Girardinichthys multiradiatus]XP_047228624.1 protein lin-54 homolog [Girardinichthys multiradiatus]